MEPGSLLRPVGAQPPHVYWVRRAVLVAVLVVLVVLVAHACGGGSGAPARTAATPQPTPSAVTTTPPPAQHKAVRPCTKSQLKVAAATDAVTYDAGQQPRLSATVRNTGPAACRYDPAPAAREWRILSGEDEVWTTSDCTRSTAARAVRLGPGKTVSYAVVWDRHRSVKGCASPGAPAQAGTYRLYVTIMGAPSAGAVFHLAG